MRCRGTGRWVEGFKSCGVGLGVRGRGGCRGPKGGGSGTNGVVAIKGALRVGCAEKGGVIVEW